MKNQKYPSEETNLYANVLEKGMYLGLVLMFCTFFLYIFGLLEPVIPLSRIDSYWNQPVHDYLVQVNREFLGWEELPLSWSWVKLIEYGDFLNFLPVALLSGVTILCYLVIVPGMFQRKDYWMATIALAETMILSFAASGVLTIAH